MPTTPTQQQMLAKIRKLLAKAEDAAASAEEAETYTAKAAQLIADYGIDAALLDADAPGSHRVADRVVELDAPYARDKAALLCDVASRLRCRAVLRTRRGAGATEHSVHLFGHEPDLARTELLFTSLLLQAGQQLARTPVPAWEHKAAFRRSWQEGFRMAVSQRLAEAESAAAERATGRVSEAGRSAELVLADRTREVEEVLAAAYPSLGFARPRTLSGSGMRDGYLAGELADLGTTRLPGDDRAALSPPRPR